MCSHKSIVRNRHFSHILKLRNMFHSLKQLLHWHASRSLNWKSLTHRIIPAKIHKYVGHGANFFSTPCSFWLSYFYVFCSDIACGLFIFNLIPSWHLDFTALHNCTTLLLIFNKFLFIILDAVYKISNIWSNFAYKGYISLLYIPPLY